MIGRSDPATPARADTAHAQRVRLKRTGYALAGGVVMSLLFALLQRQGLTRLDGNGFAALMGTFWAGNLLFPALIASGLNLRFAEPSLTLAQMLWATTASFALVYVALEGRSLLIMVYLLAMMFGTFRLRTGQFLAVTVYALILYAICIASLERGQPEHGASYGELLNWLVFFVVMVGFALMGSEMSRLRARLERRNRELAEARDAAERASRARARFLAATSDELRTPLNAILGAADVVDMTRLAPAERDALERAHRAGGYLLSLVNSMIDHTRLDAGEVELRNAALDLRHELAELAAMMAPRARERGLRIDVSAPPEGPVLGDAMRLREVLVHLLRNTLRVGRGEAIRVHAARDAADPRRMSFTVAADFGDPGAGADAGDGLAVALCAQLVESMGGSLALDQEATAAQRFRFSVPLPPAQPPAAPPASTAARAPRVLLVDDSEDNRLLIRAFLAHEVAALDEAVDGLDGLERFRESRYDVVLMDMHMPRMDGIAATRAMREAERGRGNGERAVILALTADDSVNDRTRSLDAGCDDHLVKPVSKKTLLAALAAHTGAAG